MDIATILGLLLGMALVLMAILLGGDIGSYLNLPSMLIVIGGAFAATMLAYPLGRFLSMHKVLMRAIFTRPQNPVDLINQMVELAETARRDGILALEGTIENIDDEFLVNGIRMAVDGTDPEVIQLIMETELENLVERHDSSRGMLEAIGKYAPAFGMIGTLIGLVAMLNNMDDPSKIGAGMATALLTTLYGSMLANMVFLPMADKLAIRSSEEVLAKTIITQGVMAVQSGDNPRSVQAKLYTFVPPSMRLSEQQQAA